MIEGGSNPGNETFVNPKAVEQSRLAQEVAASQPVTKPENVLGSTLAKSAQPDEPVDPETHFNEKLMPNGT